MATATNKTIGLELLCPECASTTANLSVNLNDLSRIECRECGAVYTARAAADKLARLAGRWEAVAARVESIRQIAE